MKSYVYKNCPIPGGGFVTGLLFNPSNSECLYARTDIGGVYSYNFLNSKWESLINHVTAEDCSETYPISIAVNEKKKDSLYIACGDGKSGKLCISNDCGKSFVYYDIPCVIHGNMSGRATGERLIVREKDIYFGSQTAGLLYSDDEGKNWSTINVCVAQEKPEKNITFIWENSGYDRISDAGDIMIVGCSGGENHSEDNVRGCTSYIFNKASKRFQKLPYPQNYTNGDCKISGFVPQRCCSDGTYLYITYAFPQTDNYNLYACDSGSCFDGRLYRYRIENGETKEVVDITPVDIENNIMKINGGLGGVACADNVLVCSSIAYKGSDRIWCSKDNGATWNIILQGLEKGEIEFDVPYMKPKYNGNNSLIHWLSDLKISPFNHNCMLFNTGTGVFGTNDLMNVKSDKTVHFKSFCDGIEETVHLNVYSLPKGEVKIIDIVGDLGAFAFTDLNEPCENSFADEENNRWITCLNGDFVENQPEIVVVTPRGNWTGKTKGGVIISYDQCKSWKLLAYPSGLTTEIDKLMENIQRPNVDSGWVAITADAKRILWTISNGQRFSSNCTVFTDNLGDNWNKSTFLDTNNNEYTEEFSVQVFSDRLNSEILYAFGECSKIFISTDKGKTFKQKIVHNLPNELFKLRSHYQIQLEFDKSGVIWIAADKYGLYKLSYDIDKDIVKVKKITGEDETVQCVGVGIPLQDSTSNTLYISGRINGQYGFYRSGKEGVSWERINKDNQMFGEINAISGDRRVKGRFYLATGSNGLIYGDEI